MKYVCVKLSIGAVLLAAVAVPVVGNGAKAKNLWKPGVAVQVPQHLASGWPTPWPKKPTVGVAVEAPQQLASGWPTPWPKKPGVTQSKERVA